MTNNTALTELARKLINNNELQEIKHTLEENAEIDKIRALNLIGGNCPHY